MSFFSMGLLIGVRGQMVEAVHGSGKPVVLRIPDLETSRLLWLVDHVTITFSEQRLNSVSED
jgi:hypothetical protein